MPSPPPRAGLRGFISRHPIFSGILLLGIAIFLAADAWLITRRVRYEQETERLRAGMTEFERDRTDAILTAERRRTAMMVELVRQQARGDQELHLAVSLDSGVMYLRRAGAVLRAAEVEVGPSRRVGVPPDTVHVSAPLGKGAIQRVIEGGGAWEAPAWLLAERGVASAPSGLLGPVAIVMEGGTVIYSLPASGPLADSSYVMPGAVRARAEDLRAIVANLRAGAPVYFY